MAANPRKVVVFSGGSAANSLVDVFGQVIEKNNCALTYVIPISDNGGSSSELIRVFGGPGIGDVRSMNCFISFSSSLSLPVLIFIFQNWGIVSHFNPLDRLHNVGRMMDIIELLACKRFP